MASIQKRVITWTTKAGEKKQADRYQAQFRDRNNRQHRKLFKLRRDAQKWLDEQTAGIVTGVWADPRAGKETFQAFAERWRQRQMHAPNTEATFESVLRNHVYPSIGGMRLDAIVREDVQRLVKAWTETAAATTVETRYTMLAIVLRAAVKEKVIPTTPCVEIKLPRIEPKSSLVPITTDVVLALRSALPERYQALVTVAAGSGMRRGEILGLTLDRASSAFGTIRVDRQLSLKGGGDRVVLAPPKTEASVRTIPVAQVVTAAIAEHAEQFGVHSSGLIFTSQSGGPLRTSTLHQAWQAAAREVGTAATPHDLRHFYASVQIRGGQSIKVLQALLGHKSATETWDTYGHLMGDEDDRSRSLMQDALAPSEHSMSTVDGLADFRRRSEPLGEWVGL